MSDEMGRPRVYKGLRDPMPRVTARMSDWHIRVALRLGNGNYSDGVRRALERMADHMSPEVLERPKKRKRL